jgi:hypothetical protein
MRGMYYKKKDENAQTCYTLRLAAIAVLCIFMSRLALGFQMQDSGQSTAVRDSCVILEHNAINPEDSLETIRLVECQAVGGLTNWFSSDINKSVCSSNQCRLVSIRLFWDGVGNYHHFELINNEPLTKTDHAEFSMDDYQRLHEILADSSSIFKDMTAEDLIIDKNEGVDGVSGATRKSLREYVVGDAVYTCFTLWHTVYGIRRTHIGEFLKQRADKDYLAKLLKRNSLATDFWALNIILGNSEYGTFFFKDLVDRITSGNDGIFTLALRAIRVSSLKDELSQKKLVDQIPRVDDLKKLDMIWKLSDCPPLHDNVVVQLLQFFQEGMLTPTALNYVYKLVTSRHLRDPRVNGELKKLLADKNQYVSNITRKLMTSSDVKPVP